MRLKSFEIDGCNFATLEEFFDEITRVMIPDATDWGRNLDAFNDILRGGFGTPEDGFVLIWRNADESRDRLGYEETVRQLQRRLRRCLPENIPTVRRALEQAQQNRGPTVFDWLIEIIEDHGPEQTEAAAVRLVLD